MVPNVNNRWIDLLILIVLLFSQEILADVCRGRGTVIFYGNGMFNSKREADRSLRELTSQIQQTKMYASEREIKSDLAYKRSEGVLEQLKNVVVQKGIDEFEYFWLWLSSIAEAPDWFKEAMKASTVELFKSSAHEFDGLENHFERYSKYIREGYNVILVSHSQGNLYGNQAMRKLAQYTDGSLTGSIENKGKVNPLFPGFLELFANIQVATPVKETVSNSPWSTFKDDWLMNAVRQSVGALPANLKTPGAGLPPGGDLLGHSFIKAYLRSAEGKAKILDDIQTAYLRLRYPISYFESAVLITHPNAPDEPGIADLNFQIRDPDGREFGEYDEEWPSKNLQIQKKTARCFVLKVGDSKITAETVVDDRPQVEFKFTAWPEGHSRPEREKPIEVQFQAKRGIQRWEVGVIHVTGGIGKEPLQVKVEVFPQPKPK
jgi:hypothetical protein